MKKSNEITEWDLLVDAEDISPKDHLVIEDEDGSEEIHFLLGNKGDTVYTSFDGEKYKFDAFSLEEIDGSRMIKGKYNGF
jgi:hypothetical protein